MDQTLQCPQCAGKDLAILGVDRFATSVIESGAYAHRSAVVIRFVCASCGPHERYRLKLLQGNGQVTMEWDSE